MENQNRINEELQSIIQLVFEMKEKIGDGDYVKLCDSLQRISNINNDVPPPPPSPVDANDYVYGPGMVVAPAGVGMMDMRDLFEDEPEPREVINLLDEPREVISLLESDDVEDLSELAEVLRPSVEFMDDFIVIDSEECLNERLQTTIRQLASTYRTR